MGTGLATELIWERGWPLGWSPNLQIWERGNWVNHISKSEDLDSNHISKSEDLDASHVPKSEDLDASPFLIPENLCFNTYYQQLSEQTNFVNQT